MNNIISRESIKINSFDVDRIRYQTVQSKTVQQTSNKSKIEMTTLIILEMLNDAIYDLDVSFKNLIDVGLDQGLSQTLAVRILDELFESNRIEYKKDKDNNIIVKALKNGGVDHG